MNTYEKYLELKNNLNKYTQDNLSEIAKDFFQSLNINSPNLEKIIIKGYTPNFNDGEPCEHTQHSTIAKHEWHEYYECDENTGDDAEELYESITKSGIEYGSEEYYNKFDETFKIYNKNLTDDERGVLNSKLYESSELLYEIYGTNWIIIIDFEDGKILVSHDDYEPGY